MVLSHWMAERRYGWSWDRQYMGRALRFCWPLMLGSMLFFVAQQTDRVLIGGSSTITNAVGRMLDWDLTLVTAFSKSDLAIFSVALIVTQMPSVIVGRVLGTQIFPALARNRGDEARFGELYVLGTLVNVVLNSMAAIFFVIGGEALLVLIYSERYSGVDVFIGWLALSMVFRSVRGAVQGAAIARGDSKLPLLGLSARAAVLPLAVWVSVSGGTLVDLVGVGVMGEALGAGVAILAMRARQGIAVQVSLAPAAFSLIGLGMVLLGPRIGEVFGHGWFSIAFGLAAAGVTPLLALACYPSLRHQLRVLVAERRVSGIS